MCGFELAVVIDQPYDFVGASWMFMGINMLFMTLVAGTLDPTPPTDNIDAILRALSRDRKAIGKLRRAMSSFPGGVVGAKGSFMSAAKKPRLGVPSRQIVSKRLIDQVVEEEDDGDSTDSETDAVLHLRLLKEARRMQEHYEEDSLFGPSFGLRGVSKAAVLYVTWRGVGVRSAVCVCVCV